MRVEYKQIKAYTEKDEKTEKWGYIICRDNRSNTEELFRSKYIYNSEQEANQAISTEGNFAKLNAESD